MPKQSCNKPSISIHIGAIHDDVVVDGVSFDRAGMPKKDKNFLRNVIRDGLGSAGYFKKERVTT